MKVYIRDRNEILINSILNEITDPPDKRLIMINLFGVEVEASHGDIFSGINSADAFVSPANSFGYMDGGIDLVYCERLGWHLQDDLQKYIREYLIFQELLIGEAVSIKTGNQNWPNMIAAPTMRMPGPTTASNIFLATRAAIYEALKQGYKTILMPGMGTGTGKVSAGDATEAMLYGIGAAKNYYDKIYLNIDNLNRSAKDLRNLR